MGAMLGGIAMACVAMGTVLSNFYGGYSHRYGRRFIMLIAEYVRFWHISL